MKNHHGDTEITEDLHKLFVLRVFRDSVVRFSPFHIWRCSDDAEQRFRDDDPPAGGSRLDGQKPDRLPFLDRLENWHRWHTRAGTLPREYDGLTLGEIHAAVGMGQQKFVVPYGLRLRGVEVAAEFNGEAFYREARAGTRVVPRACGSVASDRPGVTVTHLTTPVGKLTVRHEVLPEMVAMGVEPYLREHLIKDAADYRTVEHILERGGVRAAVRKAGRCGGAGRRGRLRGATGSPHPVPAGAPGVSGRGAVFYRAAR